MKKVLLTGANGQLGKAIFDVLKDDYKVITTDKEGSVDFYANLTKLEEIQNLVARVIDVHKNINILINNAGIGVFTPMMERTWEEFDEVMKVNCYGTFFLSKEVLKHMKDGRIINIASMYGIVSPDESIYGDSGRNSSEVYGMSKAGIIQLTKYLATHTHEYSDITCNCISPGGIVANQGFEFITNYSMKVPSQKMAHAIEVANVVKFLCSDDASYINGANIVVDGGYTIW